MVELLIENAYKNIPLTTTLSDHIFEYSSIRLENGVKEFSRYQTPILESTYDPYKLTLTFIRNLHKKFIVLRNAPIEAEELDDNIICCSPDKVVVNEFAKTMVTDPLITDSGDITPMGLYGFLFGRCYGDLYFKAKIEEALMKLGYKRLRFSNKEVLLYERATRYNLMNNITRFDDYNRNGELFFWRD